MINPINNSSNSTHAAEIDPNKCQTTEQNGVCAMELGLMMNGTNDAYNELPATILSTTEATFREYNFTVRAVDTTPDGYKLFATAVGTTGADGTDYTNKLVNMDDPEKSVITPVVGEVLGSAIPAGQWGYAFTKGANLAATPDTLTYKAVPTGTAGKDGTASPIDTGTGTTYDKTTGTHTDLNYKLYFGARAEDGMRSGHYRTQVQLSLVADPKSVASTMQQFAETGACSSISIGDSKQLTDDRTASGLGKTTYWVSKLKDGKCWMTQNLDLALAQGNKLSPVDTDITTEYTVPSLDNYADPGMINYKVSAASANYHSSGCGDPTNTSQCGTYFEAYTGTVFGDEEAHYLIGNYYSWNIAMAGQTTGGSGSICPKGWRLPINSEYKIITDLGNNSIGANAVRLLPYYFIPTGYYINSTYHAVASRSYYWSSTPNNTSAEYLYFDFNAVYMNTSTPTTGFSVRCVLK